jgi:hypothetical protein
MYPEDERRVWFAAEELDKLLNAMDLTPTIAVNAASKLHGAALSYVLSQGCDNETQQDIINIVDNELNRAMERVVGKVASLIQCGSTYIN